MPSASSPLIVLPVQGAQIGRNDAVVPQGTWAYIENGEYTPYGTAVCRWGTGRINTTAVQLDTPAANVTVQALADFHRQSVVSGRLTDSQKRVMVAAVNSVQAIYKDDLDGTWDSLGTWTSGTSTDAPSIVIADGYAVFFNGVSAPQKWDQTTLDALGGSAPVAKGAVWHLRRLFTVGEASGDGSTVKYCAASDITDWTGSDTGSFVLDENDGDYVVGAGGSLNGSIYFFKGPYFGSIFQLAGTTPSTFTSRRISNTAPCLSHRGIVTTPQDIFWASYDGFHSLTALLTTGKSWISAPLARFVDGVYVAITDTASLCGFHNPVKHQVGWTIGDTAVFVYDYFHKQWAYWSMPETVTALGTRYRSNTTDFMYGGTSGIAYNMLSTQYQDTNAAGTATNFTFRLVSPTHYSFPAATPIVEKAGRAVTVWGRSNVGTVTVTGASLTVELLEENDEVSSATVTLPGDPSTDTVVRHCQYVDGIFEGRSRWCAVRIAHTSTANIRPEITGYAINVDPGEDASREAS